jgi:hypothetical protein
MKGSDLFGVIVRTFGLVSLVYGVWSGFGVLFPHPPYTSRDYVPGAAVTVGIGLFLLLGADLLVRVSYWSRRHWES